MKEAMLYTAERDLAVQCNLCRHLCLIQSGRRGTCNVRENRDGKLYSIFYAKPCSIAVDPIEKKPLFHFHPGSYSLSLATYGCNFKCPFCQNWEISQYDSKQLQIEEILPEKIVESALSQRCSSISYTYTEPTIFFEYAYDISRLAKQKGLSNIFVTNGYMTRSALDTIRPYLDAANIDLKAFRKETYRRFMKAELDGVLDSIEYMKKIGVWIEVTTLIVPGMNDDEKELQDIAKFIVGIGRDIPWHVSRFIPHYKESSRPVTPSSILKKAYEIGKKEGLRYVYVGNVPGDETENTFCYNCNNLLIEREGFRVVKNELIQGSCPKCKTKLDGIF